LEIPFGALIGDDPQEAPDRLILGYRVRIPVDIFSDFRLIAEALCNYIGDFHGIPILTALPIGIQVQILRCFRRNKKKENEP
jgi:hypothetical protein